MNMTLVGSYRNRMAVELTTMFGSIYDAPVPAMQEPWFGSPTWFRERKWKHTYHRITGQHFTPLSRMRYWQQRAFGQGYDDAGGYIIRCWCAASGYPL